MPISIYRISRSFIKSSLLMKTNFWLLLFTPIGLFSTQQTQAQTYQPSDRIPVADNSQIGTQVSGANNNFDITGGLQRGQNLFHSFQDFSVPTGGSANFANSAGNRSIITRVTGNLFSDINGLVNTNGANFLLINPAGIVFGNNAQLNVGKAFVGSTANSIDLVGGGRSITFGTNPSGDAPLLSVAPNVLFDVARLNLGGGTGAISNFGTLETTNPNQYIGLIGGNITFNGGTITAPGARVEVGGLAQSGTIGFSLDNGVLFPANVERGNVSLIFNGTTPSLIDVEAGGGGSVSISAKDITLKGAGTGILTGIAEGLGSPTAIAGDIMLNATRDISLSDSALIFNSINSKSQGKAGKIEVFSKNLSVKNGGLLQSVVLGKGVAGSIKIAVAENVSFDDSYAFSRIEKGGEGKGNKIEITANNLYFTNSAQLVTSTLGKGDAGDIAINIVGDASFDGKKGIFTSGLLSRVGQGAEGNGGKIEIIAGNLSLTNSADLQATTSGKGDAGSIKVKVTSNTSFDDSLVVSRVEKEAIGKGGGIEIVTGNLLVKNSSQLSSSTYGKGDAGNIKITATENVSFDGIKNGFRSSAFSTIEKGGDGKAGGIEITSNKLSITNDAQLVAGTKDKGEAGNILLQSKMISLNKGSILSKSTNSTGGNINIFSTDLLMLRNNSTIATDSDSIGKNGNGGNITINSPLIVAAPTNNDITANAYNGTGGRVEINSQGLFGIQYRPKGSPLTNDITASSTFGQNGNVNISTPGTDPGKDSTELPNATTDASNQISQVCSASNRQNKLTVTGRGGLPPNANDPLTSDVIWQDARAVSTPLTANRDKIPVKLAPPAVGWVFNRNGKVTLVAAANQGQPTGTSVICPSAGRQ
jgi:filamentous hemagglutinin family protein